MEKNNFNWSERPQVVAAFSAVIAVMVWLVVTMVINPDTSIIIQNIPVDFTYDSRIYTALGLDIVNEPEAVVSVRVEGNGSTIGEIKANDIVVYPDYSLVKGPGSQVLNLVVRISNPRYTSSVSASIVSGSRTATVVFDTIVTKTLPITVKVDNLRLSEGYVLNKTGCNPSEVTLKGPEFEVSRVASVLAEAKAGDTLSDSISIPVELQFLDKNGNHVVLDYTSASTTNADVNIMVYLQRELPLAINFINIPSSFDVNTLRYSLSQETLTVAGPAAQVESLSEIAVASFDLASFVQNQSYQLPVEVPTGLVSTNGVSTVTLQFDSEKLVSKRLNVKNIRAINIPAGFKVSVETTQVNDVTVVGPKESVEGLAASNLEVVVDGGNLSVSSGLENVPVTITIPSCKDVFVTGSYTVQCNISEDS